MRAKTPEILALREVFTCHLARIIHRKGKKLSSGRFYEFLIHAGAADAHGMTSPDELASKVKEGLDIALASAQNDGDGSLRHC